MGFAEKLAGLQDVLQFDNWPMLVMCRMFDRKTGLVTYRKAGLEILVDHRGGDENGTRACIVSDMYRRHLASLGQRGPVRLLDLGANGGGFPLMLLLNGYEVIQAVCVEMNPATSLRLRLNLATNLGNRATAINAAVCGTNAPAEISLQLSRGSTGLSMYTDQAAASEPHATVPTTTITALCEQYFPETDVDICKIDIESAEYDVLQTTPESVLSRIRSLIVEFHDAERTPACLQRLQSLGFTDVTGDRDPHASKTTEVRAFRRR